MANTQIADIYQKSSGLAKYPFETYWPDEKLRICITGAGGFIARCGEGGGRCTPPAHNRQPGSGSGVVLEMPGRIRSARGRVEACRRIPHACISDMLHVCKGGCMTMTGRQAGPTIWAASPSPFPPVLPGRRVSRRFSHLLHASFLMARLEHPHA